MKGFWKSAVNENKLQAGPSPKTVLAPNPYATENSENF
jgi:hypothetical protein